MYFRFTSNHLLHSILCKLFCKQLFWFPKINTLILLVNSEISLLTFSF
jgi:hypothetical protein